MCVHACMYILHTYNTGGCVAPLWTQSPPASIRLPYCTHSQYGGNFASQSLLFLAPGSGRVHRRPRWLLETGSYTPQPPDSHASSESLAGFEGRVSRARWLSFCMCIFSALRYKYLLHGEAEQKRAVCVHYLRSQMICFMHVLWISLHNLDLLT